jgi:zinc finger protein 830
MADVRSLLKQARQTKRITHPYAKYSSSGSLYCTACTLKIASEALWDTHIASTQHKENVKDVIQEGQRKAKRGIAATAMEEEEQEEQDRKRLKVDEAPVEEDAEDAEEGLPEDFFDPGMKPPTSGVDEDEFAKFQAEIAEIVRNQEDEGKDGEEDIEELQRGIVDEFDELNTLEDRVERLKRRRAALKANKDVQPVVTSTAEKSEANDSEDEDEDEEDWW